MQSRITSSVLDLTQFAMLLGSACFQKRNQVAFLPSASSREVVVVDCRRLKGSGRGTRKRANAMLPERVVYAACAEFVPSVWT